MKPGSVESVVVSPSASAPLAGDVEGQQASSLGRRAGRGRGKRRSACYACLAATFAIVVALGLTSYFLYPHVPAIYIGDASSKVVMLPTGAAGGDLLTQLQLALAAASAAAAAGSAGAGSDYLRSLMPAFRVDLAVNITVNNENYAALSFGDIQVSIYHACCADPIAILQQDTDYRFPRRANTTATVALAINSADPALSPDFVTCAQEYYLTAAGCSLQLKGSVQPRYLSFGAGVVPRQAVDTQAVLRK